MTLEVRTCPNCHGAAVVSTRMRNAPELECFTCSTCSHRWSLMDCDSRGCRLRAFVCCGQCNKFKCPNHGFHGKTATKQGICDACVTRMANVLKRPKATNWSRTGGLHQ